MQIDDIKIEVLELYESIEVERDLSIPELDDAINKITDKVGNLINSSEKTEELFDIVRTLLAFKYQILELIELKKLEKIFL